MVSDYEAIKNTFKLEGFFESETEKHTEQNSAQQNSFIIPNLIEQGDDETMKNIIKRTDGRYMAHIQVNGNRVYAYGRTKNQAIEKLKKLKKDIISYQKTNQNYTLESWSKYWLETYKKPFIQYKNYRDIEFLINEINQKLGKIYIKKLKSSEIQEFYNTYPKSRKKEKIILYLQACLQKAYETGVIQTNPCNAVVKDRKLKFDKKPFSVEEQEQIIEAVKNTDIECYIYYYLLTGIRKNELDNNIIKNLDINSHRLKVINEKQKSNIASYKYIDLSPGFVEYLLKNKEKFIYKPETVFKKFKKVLEKLKLQGGLHTLRHTFATNYYYLGVPEKLISAWLGHSTLNITQDIYVGVERKDVKKQLNKLYNNLLYKF